MSTANQVFLSAFCLGGYYAYSHHGGLDLDHEVLIRLKFAYEFTQIMVKCRPEWIL